MVRSSSRVNHLFEQLTRAERDGCTYRRRQCQTRVKQVIRSGQTYDVVDGDMDELDKVADEAHDDESHPNGPADLEELWRGRDRERRVRQASRGLRDRAGSAPFLSGFVHRFMNCKGK